MDDGGATLTDKDLIEAVIDWYEQNRTTAQLRQTVQTYLQQNVAEVTARPDVAACLPSDSEAGNTLVPYAPTVAARTEVSSGVASQKFAAYEVVPYEPIADQTDESIRSGGLLMDGWAFYYATEDFFARISFGIITMQSLAVLFCILISAAVMLGAWQISISNERQKKATYKSMTIEEADAKNGQAAKLPKLGTPPQEPQLVDVESLQKTPTDFDEAIRLLERSDWDQALAELQSLESENRSELQPLLSLLKIETLLHQRDKEASELARQVIMDGKFAGHELLFELLVARWLLVASNESRTRFLSESASLPPHARERMTMWARVCNGSTDALTESLLQSSAANAENDVCDRLFLASCHYKAGKKDQTVRELLDLQQKILGLRSSSKDSTAIWLLRDCKSTLRAKIDELLAVFGAQQADQLNQK